MTATTGTIYTLIDPRDGSVRYVGQTTQSLVARLAGHIARPAPRVKVWVAALNEVGLLPDIVAIQEGVPAEALVALEQAEITRQLLGGAELLNERGTAATREILRRRQAGSRLNQERADWMHIAEIARGALGGPLPPGDVLPVPVPAPVLRAHQRALALEEVTELPWRGSGEPPIRLDSRRQMNMEAARKELWPRVRGAWGHLRGRTRERFDMHLRQQVEKVLDAAWGNYDVMYRYISLIPWGMTAVAPWAAMAARAGINIDGEEFIAWASDDPSVTSALRLLLVEAPVQVYPLDALDTSPSGIRPSMMLAAMTAAHCGYAIPESMRSEAHGLLVEIAKDGQLTAPMASMLNMMDPSANDAAFGPDLAAQIDARLHLRSGTAQQVLAALLQLSPHRFRGVAEVIARSRHELPTVPAPDYSSYTWDLGPLIQAVVTNLLVAKMLPAPKGWEETAYVADTTALWKRWDRWEPSE